MKYVGIMAFKYFPLLSYSSATFVLDCSKNLNFGLVLELSFVLLLVLRARLLGHYCPSLQSSIELLPQFFVFAILFIKKVIDVSYSTLSLELPSSKSIRTRQSFGKHSLMPVLIIAQHPECSKCHDENRRARTHCRLSLRDRSSPLASRQ